MTEPFPLSNATLGHLSVETARYDRGALTPGIVHIGVGNFHRAHQAWYLQRLMQMGQAQDWAILGAGVRSYDITMREKLLAQDCLTTLIQLDPVQSSAELIGSMIDYLPIEDGNGALIPAMADPRIPIVSLTVTEGGYFLNRATGGFDADHPEIQHDVAHPQRPMTAFGAMVEALRLRRAKGIAPFTALSCDNLQGNGAILRQVLVSLAERTDPGLSAWIDSTVSFPNSMVDCIAPSVGPEEIALAESFGIKDAAPVIHEPFHQWVIEDDFCNGRPDWAAVGATFSSDVHAYETMKIRVLNAGHQVIIGAAELLSLTTVAEAMTHPQIAALFRKVQLENIAPLVPSVPEMDTATVIALIEQRAKQGGRSVFAIAGPPASGKSTLAEAVVAALNQGQEAPKATLLPMDGFHLDNRLLAPRGLLPRKGAPETFDAEGFCAALREIAAGERDICHPTFDRKLDLAIANSGLIKVETPIVVVEGNYLLLNAAPWVSLREVFAATVFVAPPLPVLRARLVDRWLNHGLSQAEAEARATGNDLVNAERVLRESGAADLTLGG